MTLYQASIRGAFEGEECLDRSAVARFAQIIPELPPGSLNKICGRTYHLIIRVIPTVGALEMLIGLHV